MLNQAGIPVKVLMIGEGPERKELEVLAAEEKAEQKIIFTGFQNEIESWLPAMDFFVLPSLTEGTPMALLEAMACGIPVVASAVGGVPQVIDSGKNGMLVTPGKPEEIKDAISLLYKNEALRNDISREAKETIRLRYNVEDWIGKLEAEYLKILD
jgi:glycosyltransferase involved in cell wall biosynthesis